MSGNSLVGRGRYPYGLQRIEHLRGNLLRGDEECGLLLRDEQVGHEHRVAMHVATPEVERPGDVVERRHEQGIGPLTEQLSTHPFQLRRSILSRKLQRKDLHLSVGHRRTVGPQLIERVDAGHHFYVAKFRQLPGEVVHFGRHAHHPVDAHTCLWHASQALAQPLGHRGRARDALLHEHELRARNLFRGRDEIARVGPERGLVHRHHRRARRAVEAGEPLAPFPVVGQILAFVGVATGDDKRVEMRFAHQSAKGKKPVSYDIVVHNGRFERLGLQDANLHIFPRTTNPCSIFSGTYELPCSHQIAPLTKD